MVQFPLNKVQHDMVQGPNFMFDFILKVETHDFETLRMFARYP